MRLVLDTISISDLSDCYLESILIRLLNHHEACLETCLEFYMLIFVVPELVSEMIWCSCVRNPNLALIQVNVTKQ